MSELHIVNDKNPNSKYRRLLDLIPYGVDNAISMNGLANILGIPTRNVRSLVQNCRIDGNIIARSQTGYFIPVTVEELTAYYHNSLARIKSNSASIKAVRKLLKEEEEKSLVYEGNILSGDT